MMSAAQPLEVELFECAPLRARISVRQCELNRQAARARPVTKKPHHAVPDRNLLALEPCKTCPGVPAACGTPIAVSVGPRPPRKKRAPKRRAVRGRGPRFCLECGAPIEDTRQPAAKYCAEHRKKKHQRRRERERAKESAGTPPPTAAAAPEQRAQTTELPEHLFGGPLLRAWRTSPERRLTQAAVAKVAGISSGAVCLYEGDYNGVSERVARRLSEFTGIPVERLWKPRESKAAWSCSRGRA